MPRRRWIKLWTQETFYGTTTRELEPAERWVWLGFLALAGDSVEPGTICAAPGVPWTDKQLSDVLKAGPTILESAKTKMLNHGKITINEGIIHISNWEKYQSEYDRTKKYRGTIFSGPNATPKSTTQLNVEKDVEKVQENVSSIPDQTIPDQKTIHAVAAIDENMAKISHLYEDNIGRLTPLIAERLKDIVGEYPSGWFEEALKEAVELEHRNLKYIEKILERWQTEGFKAPRKREGGRSEQPRKRPKQERARPIIYIKGSGEDPGREDQGSLPRLR